MKKGYSPTPPLMFVQQDSESLLRIVRDLAGAVRDRGGRVFLVGGSVRDELLGRPHHDYDVEVYGVSADDLTALVEKYGLVSDVGRSFGILKLHHPAGDIDVAIPRKDSRLGSGHRGILARTSPDLTYTEAARRRDFTINAILKDPLTDEIVDPFNGQADLNNQVLRQVDANTFGDDPLRAVRAFQFVARFGLTLEDETRKTIERMMPRLRELPPERFRPEWEKLLLAPEPSRGLQVALEVGYFRRWYPEIAAMADTPQDPIHHPEGSVWQHTLIVVDRARQVLDQQPELVESDRLVVMLAAFTHDIGKVSTTGEVSGRLRSLGHEDAGVGPAKHFVQEIGFSAAISDMVGRLVAEHLKPMVLYVAQRDGHDISRGAFRRLVRRLHPATLPQLLALSEADYLGRGPFMDEVGQSAMPAAYPARAWWREKIEEFGLDKQFEPILYGRDLIERGWKPDPRFGQLLRVAEDLAQNGHSRTELLAVLNQSASFEESMEKLEALGREERDA